MTTTGNVTCPFCSLLCDDLSARVEQGRLHISDKACRLAERGFTAPPPPREARLKGVPVAIERAVTAASRLLKHSRRPLIAGLGTDVNGIRAALQLGEKTGGTLLHGEESQAPGNLKTLQSRGWIMTTLAEVKNRADAVVFVGNNVTGNHPRFIERCINTAHSLFLGKNKTRKLAYLGRPGRQELKQFIRAPVIISSHDNEIANDLALLRAKLADNRRLDYNNVQPAKNHGLDEIAALIKSANYGVFLWSPSALPGDHADLIIDSLADLLRDLNDTRRAAGLSLDGSNGGVSFRNVATWQTGYPSAISFVGGYPSTVLNPGHGYPLDTDSLVWISSFADEAPPALNVPTLVLSSHQAAATRADVYIPIGAPGIDHAGNLFRTDSVINMPLKKVRNLDIPSAAEMLDRIMTRMEGKPA